MADSPYAVINGYCTLAELFVELKKQDDEAFSDSQTNPTSKNGIIGCMAINQASRNIDLETQRFFYAKTITAESLDIYALSTNRFYINGIARTKLIAPAPFISVTSLVVDGVTLTENTDFYVYADYIELSGQMRWSAGQKNIVITCQVGYETTPAEIKKACLAMASAYTALGTSLVTDENGGTFSVVNKSVPKWVAPILAKYRRKDVV